MLGGAYRSPCATKAHLKSRRSKSEKNSDQPRRTDGIRSIKTGRSGLSSIMGRARSTGLILWDMRVEMTSKQAIKGNSYERSIVNYFRESGFVDAERTRAGWSDDRGDVHGVTSPEGFAFTIECKNHRGDNLPGWCRELSVEIANAGGILGAVVHKKRGDTDPASQYATLPLALLVQLLKEAGYK